MYLQCKKKPAKGTKSGPDEKPRPSFPLKVKSWFVHALVNNSMIENNIIFLFLLSSKTFQNISEAKCHTTKI
jgi:hypothetical protein